MTRKNLQKNIIAVIIIYAIFIFIGIIIYLLNPGEKNKYFNVFKDLILLWVAIPAAYLGDCFQRRAAFTVALRQLWGNIIEAVNQARQFTFENSPTQKVYGDTLKELSKSIDEVRGVYCNIGETATDVGIYPYESLKEISYIISGLGFYQYDKQKADNARKLIDQHWGLIKFSFLSEFDRPCPSVINTPYTESIKSLKKIKRNYWLKKIK